MGSRLESPVAGLDRIVGVCRGALADELSGVVTDIRTGTTIADAFDALAARTGVSSIARFAEGLAVAVERGTPLVDVLHAQAADVRESARRELIEAGGRKEVAMMLPVVFRILSVIVLFAFGRLRVARGICVGMPGLVSNARPYSWRSWRIQVCAPVA